MKLHCAESEAKVRMLASVHTTSLLMVNLQAVTQCGSPLKLPQLAQQLFKLQSSYFTSTTIIVVRIFLEIQADKSQPVSQFQLKNNVFSG